MLREVAPNLPLPPALDTTKVRVIDVEPVPVLALNTLPMAALGVGKAAQRSHLLDFAAVSFDYEGVSIKAESRATLVPLPGGSVIHIRRRYDTEKQRLLELRKTGLQMVPAGGVYSRHALPETLLALPDVDAWPSSWTKPCPRCDSKGWRVTMAPTFRHNVIEIDAIEGTARQAGDGWFDLEMGITLGDRTVRLEPLLADLFRRDRRWLGGGLETIDDEEDIDLTTDRAERLAPARGPAQTRGARAGRSVRRPRSWKGDDAHQDS